MEGNLNAAYGNHNYDLYKIIAKFNVMCSHRITRDLFQIKRRYTDFRNLNSSIEQLTGEKDISEFPGKKVTGNMGENNQNKLKLLIS